jgi:hypothetical protein
MKRKEREENQARYSRAGVLAREKKKREQAQETECVGTVTFDGPMFGGVHVMRCLFSEDYSDRYLMIDVDGAAFRPLTVEGVRKVIAKRCAVRVDISGTCAMVAAQ